MKRFTTTLFALAALICTAMAQQETAEQLFDQFVNDPTYSGCVKTSVNYRSTEGDLLTMRNESYTFALPTQWRDKVETLAAELERLQPSAYNIFMRRAGSGDQAKVNISVERGNDIQLGAYPDRNYLAVYFRSAADSLRRHAYAMAWYEDDDCVKGSLYKIYGLDPAKKTAVRPVSKVYINGQEFDMSDFNALRLMGMNVSENGRVSFGGNRTATSNVTVVRNPQALAREAKREEAKQRIETMSSTPVSINNSTEFIAEFKNLHDLFIAVQGDYMTTQKFQSTILTRMDGMVQEKGSLLTMKEERQLCIKMLKEMKKNVTEASDGVMSAHADLIIKRLKKL